MAHTHLASGLHTVAHPPIRLGHRGIAAPAPQGAQVDFNPEAALGRCVWGSLSKSAPHMPTLMQHRCWVGVWKHLHATFCLHVLP
eukprot:3926421-Pleurochrysis_carterae.AAC.1